VWRLGFQRSGARSNDEKTPIAYKALITSATTIIIIVPIIIFFFINGSA
jgi:hypothetical protein